VISNSIISIVIFVIAYMFYYKYMLEIKEKRLYIISVVLGFIFSFFMVCGSNIIVSDCTLLNTPETLFFILSGTPLWSSGVMFLLENIDSIQVKFKISKLDTWFERVMKPKKMFVFAWLFVFLAWTPGLVASYPGVYGYDSVFQMGFYVENKIDLWHPLAHTYLVGICIEDIGGILGSREAGMFVYSIIQMIFLSAVFALISYYLAKKKCPAILQVFMLLITAFLPTNAILSFSCTKDVPFAAFLAVSTYCLMQITEDEMYLSKKRNVVLFIISLFGIMIFRNQGIYVIVLGLMSGIILLKNQWKRMVALLLASVLIFSTYSGPVTKLLNGVEASKGIEEMLSVPIMQITRAVCHGSDVLTEEEITLAEEYIPPVHEYDTYGEKALADYFKEEFNSNRFKDNPLEFVKLWGSIGLKVPMAYIDAFARLSIGLWYPDMNYRDPEAYHPYWEYENTPQNQEEWIVLERSTPQCMQWLADFYYDLSYNNTYQKFPVISMLFSGGLYVWVLFVYIAWCIYKKEYRLLFPAGFLVLYWLTMLLGPVVIYRYLYPLMISLPILITKMITYKENV